MKKPVVFLLCVVIIGGAIFLGKILIESKPKPKPNEIVEQHPFVETIQANLVSPKASVEAFGVVQARTLTNLIAEVPGMIKEVAPFEEENNNPNCSFRNGGFFERGDLLVKIEDTSLLAKQAEALANLRRAEYQLAQERALAEQAKIEWGDRDWDLAPELVKRIPQTVKAEAEKQSAEAHFEQAKQNVSKSNVRAPFRGRILNILADKGQQVGAGASSTLAKIYSIKTGEVQFALSKKEISFLGFDEGAPNGTNQIVVQVLNEQGNITHNGLIDRSQGLIDPKTRLHNLVASFRHCFTDPYESKPKNHEPLSIGQFVKLKLIGPEIKVFIVPISAFREQDTILVLDQDNRIALRKVKSVKKDAHAAWVTDGIKEGEQICITPLDIIAEGMKVQISPSDLDQNFTRP